MELVIPLRETPDKAQELKYALRAFERHHPVDSVVVIGYDPPWLKHARHIAYEEHQCPIRNVLGKLVVYLPEAPEEFLFSNDDIFMNGALPLIPFHRDDAPQRDPYYGPAYDRAVSALKALQFEEVRDFELHIPLVLNTAFLKDVLTLADGAIAWRTLYGNIVHPASALMTDTKVVEWKEPKGWCFSTASSALSGGMEWLKAQYPEPSRWER